MYTIRQALNSTHVRLVQVKKVIHLYDQFRPVHYILELIPDKQTMSFTGTVIVGGKKFGRPSQRLTLHQKDLKVTKAEIVHHAKDGDTAMAVDRVNHHNGFNEVRIHTKELLNAGSYTISLQFKGKITRNMNGMYPCFFTHEDKEKMLIGTQFESHHAREVFPCVDEPEAKATFDLTLTTPKGEAVVSNTPIKTQTTKANKSVTTFERTPHMSTYLLAFVFGEMDFLEGVTKQGVTVRTYATPDNVKFTRFALETGIKILEFYDDYFGIPYPLAKCDMIALPDFASGAMENWGCITYREHAFLVDPENTSVSSKQYVAMVVAHELAHQWFGNLVTMQWWTDLWLNEGFASWIEYMAVDHIFPEWKMWTQFIVDEQQQALKLDALEHTHAIEVPINHPDEIRTIFDAISYSKGSSVIHMLYHYLGHKAFQAGLRYYLKQNAYKNTVTSDLWSALEEASEKPVQQFMQSWTSLPGYPIVSANVSETNVELHQERFVLNPKGRKRLTQHTNWPIALLPNHKSLPEVLSTQETGIHSHAQQLKLNMGQSGLYRVAYNAAHIHELGQMVRRGRLTTLDRLGILADSFEAAKAGYCETTQALHLLEAYKLEDDNAVWDVIATNVGAVRSIMNDDPLREAMKPYIRKLVAKQLDRLGWEPKANESYFDTLLRPTILGMAAGAEEEPVVKKALSLFSSASSNSGTILNPNVRGLVYSTAARHGNKDTFNTLVAMHNATSFSEERLNICAALCSFEDPKLIKKALAMITTKDVRLQDVAYWLVYSFSNRHAKEMTWEWMVTNWKWLEKNLGTDLSFYRLPIYSGRAFSDEGFLPEFRRFFTKHMSTAFERNILQGIEIIEWQSAWRKRDLNLIRTYFTTLQDPGSHS